MAPKPEWLQRPPGYELFFTPMEIAFKPGIYEAIQFAYQTSKHGHAGQVREGGMRYFDHPKAAAWIYFNELKGRDPRLITLLLLHDIPEDSFIMSWYRINLNFGEDMALDVRAVTKLLKTKESPEEYLARIIDRGPHAILGKLCDRLHNLRTLGACASEKRQLQIAQTQACHLPMLIPALRKCGDQWIRFAVALEPKIDEAIQAYAE